MGQTKCPVPDRCHHSRATPWQCPSGSVSQAPSAFPLVIVKRKWGPAIPPRPPKAWIVLRELHRSHRHPENLWYPRGSPLRSTHLVDSRSVFMPFPRVPLSAQHDAPGLCVAGPGDHPSSWRHSLGGPQASPHPAHMPPPPALPPPPMWQGLGATNLPLILLAPPGTGATPLPGFIPRAQNLFAKTYSEICKEARSDFARQQLRAAGREQELQNAGRLSQGTKGNVSHQSDRPPVTWAGFTGFVPRARFLIGAGYPLTTHRALVEFGQARGRRPEGRKGSPVLPPLKSYPTDMGLLPHYAGYVPGYKFQFGHTYGQLTHNALGLSTLEKQLAD
uniref:Ciliary microtubule inner protein 2B n=1 Tax=Chelonoidis abingdonii TaxID=106734 RepID=A0A8C0GEU2_CHEAB